MKIDCFIPWQSDEQVAGTLAQLQADEHVAAVHLLREGSAGQSTSSSASSTLPPPTTVTSHSPAVAGSGRSSSSRHDVNVSPERRRRGRKRFFIRSHLSQ